MVNTSHAARRNPYFEGQHGAEEPEDVAARLALVRERDALRAEVEAMKEQEPIFWWRPCTDGTYAGPLHNDTIETVRKQSGAWSPLYAAPGAQPTPDFADAYKGAMEEGVIWEKRALEAEGLNRKFIAEINGPTHMGEPVQPATSAPTIHAAKAMGEEDGPYVEAERLEAAERQVEILRRLLEAKRQDHAVIQGQNSDLRAEVEALKEELKR